MKFIKVKPGEGHYLKRSTVVYENSLGKVKHYEIFGRREVRTEGDLKGYVAGVMAVIKNDKGEYLVCEEFRCGVNETLTGFPTGMVGFGESIEDAAIREVYEETGVEVKIDSITQPLYINPAMSIEKMVIAYGHVCGNEKTRVSDNANEEITSKWINIREEFPEMNKSRMSLASYLILNNIFETSEVQKNG